MNAHTHHNHRRTLAPPAPDHTGHVEHVTPAYVEDAGPHVAHAPLGHALDPHRRPARTPTTVRTTRTAGMVGWRTT